MADESRKTEPMARAANVASMRKTERMGIERDTIRDLPPVEPAAPATPLPRGTIPMAHAPRGKGPSSDRVEGGLVEVGSGKVPDALPDERVDLSKVDPRRAKTMKVARRPREFLAPSFEEQAYEDEETALRRAPNPGRSSAMIMGVALIVLLVILALVLGLLVAKQRGLLGHG